MAKDKKKSRPDIFRHHDYRNFLSEWFSYLKNSEKLSQRALARKAGLSAAYLPLVVSGKRSLSADSLNKLLPFLKLESRERRYLELLRTLTETENLEARAETFAEIQKIRSYGKHNTKEIEVYHYLSQWFYVAIREMAHLPGFNLDPEWIQRHLRVKPRLSEVRKAIDFLLERGYLKQTKADGITIPEKDIDCVGGVFRLALGKFHQQMLDVMTSLVRETRREERKLSGYTLACSRATFSRARDILEQALDDIRQLEKGASDISDSVYHIAVMAVPLTNSLGGE